MIWLYFDILKQLNQVIYTLDNLSIVDNGWFEKFSRNVTIFSLQEKFARLNSTHSNHIYLFYISCIIREME